MVHKFTKEFENKRFKNNGVLVKFKKKQDLRVDLPTVGLKTLERCKSVGLKGVVVKSKQNIFFREKNVLILQIKIKCLFIKMKKTLLLLLIYFYFLLFTFFRN